MAHVIHVSVIPIITQHSTYKISPSESSAPSCLPYNIDIAFGQFFAFRYHMANCLITFSAILHSAGTFCLSIVFIVLVLKAWSCAAIIISSMGSPSLASCPFFQSLPSLYISYFFYAPPKLPINCFSWKCSFLSCCNDAAFKSQLLAYHLRTAYLYTAFF